MFLFKKNSPINDKDRIFIKRISLQSDYLNFVPRREIFFLSKFGLFFILINKQKLCSCLKEEREWSTFWLDFLLRIFILLKYFSQKKFHSSIPSSNKQIVNCNCKEKVMLTSTRIYKFINYKIKIDHLLR